jgi:hypothetical protein
MNESRIEALMKGIDRTLLRENLRLTPAQRLDKFISVHRFTSELRRAGEVARRVLPTKEARRR